MATTIKGSFVSLGTATPLNLPIDPDYVELFVRGNAAGDNWTSVANPGVTKIARWFKGMTLGHALTTRNTDGAATDEADYLTTGGFYIYRGTDTATNLTSATGTAISQAATAVVTDAAATFVVGDRLILGTCTGMRQIETMTTEVIAVNAGVSYTIGINSAAFAAPGTACTARRLPALPMFGPRRMLITNISAPGTAMVVTLTETNPYHVGGKVRLKVPEEFGMYQANDLIGTITAVGARSITLDIDTNGFTAFAFPLSAAVPFTHAQVIPVGEDATILTDSITNNAYRGLILGTGICGPAGATVYYTATRADGVKTTSP